MVVVVQPLDGRAEVHVVAVRGDLFVASGTFFMNRPTQMMTSATARPR